MADPHDEHRWVLERVIGLELDLLPDEEGDRVRAHLAGCAECREQAETLLPDPEVRPYLTPGHLPVGVVARWRSARETLPEPQRTWARDHLRECRSCREELESLGFAAPFLSEPSVLSTHEVASEPIPIRGPRPRRWPWLASGWAGGLATAAALALLFRADLMQPRGEAPAPPPPAAQPPSSPAPLPAAPVAPPSPGIGAGRHARLVILDRPLRAIELRSTLRSAADSDTPSVRVASGAELIQLRVPPLIGVDGEARIRVELVSPTGATVVRDTIDQRRLFGNPVLLFTAGTRLGPGLYALQLETIEPIGPLGERESARYPFRVTR
jgi:hypothetical protein